MAGIGGCENRIQEVRQLAPLGVLAVAANVGRKCLQPREGLNLELQLRDGARGSGLIEDLLLGCLDLVFGRVLEVLDVVGIEHRLGPRWRGRGGTTLQQLQLAEPLFQPLAPTAQRLVDCLRGRGQAPLEDSERKAHGSGTLVILQCLGAVEFLANVLGDFLIQLRLGIESL